MKKFYYFSVLLYFLSLLPKALSIGKYIDNVGTVLFFDADNSKKCWNYDDIALLTSRKIFQDVLPSEDVLKINSDNVVHNMIEYFHLILEIVGKTATGKSKHLMLLAVSDTFGGYINHFLLPATKYSYYAGFLSFESVHKLMLLFEELKNFLKTNGASWARPVGYWSTKDKLRIEPYRFNVDPNNTNACSNIIYYEAKSGPGSLATGTVIPMPFFDSKKEPIAIAIPFKTFSLRNIESKQSAFVLVKYYVAAKRCIFSRPNKAQAFRVFTNQFRSWLDREVLPRLHDDRKFYAAFGGVYRLHRNVNKENTKLNASLERKDGVNVMPKIEKMYQNITKGHVIKSDSPELEAVVRNFPEASNEHSINFFIIVLVISLFIWALVGTLYICYQFGCNGKKNTFLLKKKSMKVSTPATSINVEAKESVLKKCLKPSSSKSSVKKVVKSTHTHTRTEGYPFFNKTSPTDMKKEKSYRLLRKSGGRSYSTPRSGFQSSGGRNKSDGVSLSDKSETSIPEQQYNFDFSLDDSSSEETDFTSEEDLIAENHSR